MGKQIPLWQNIKGKKSTLHPGSDEAVKRKMFGSLKTARRQSWPRQGHVRVIFQIEMLTQEHEEQGLFLGKENHRKWMERLLVKEIPSTHIRIGEGCSD